MIQVLPKLITILGPTASGKSDMAMKFAQKFNGEIVNADSRQIYKGFILGTNAIKGVFKKINDETMYESNGVFHHLIQFIAPEEKFSLAQYKKLAIDIVNRIIKRGRVPFLVGGTGLYIRSVTENLIIPKIKPNQILRQKLESKTLENLLNDLKTLDPESASLIDKNNKRRLVRALEIVIISGEPISKLKGIGEPLYNCLKIGIKIDKEKLKLKIKERAKKLLISGFIEETKNLLKKYPSNLECFSAIPYKVVIGYLNGEIAKEEIVEKISLLEYHYAKRQLTWFSKEKNISWCESYEEAEGLVAQFL